MLALRSARASRASEIEASRLRDLEARLAERKYDVYKPMIELLRNMLVPGGAEQAMKNEAELIEKLSDFTSWVSIYGSDEAVRSFHHFMQGAYHNAPAEITLRLYADFVIAARRDIGDRTTTVTQADILGTRIKDLSDDDNMSAMAVLSFPELCKRVGWTPPWATPARRHA